ncbi:KH domain-containing protein [Candidatus Woesearchaeota archaeon]|nr:KH domain-containing protein [Candidatus Woesearchaeota archaeon]
MKEYNYELRIPKERIAVLIGKNGKIKKQIESATKTKIAVDSKEGDISIIGKDAINLFNAREVIKAIGRGFNPEIAFLLLKGDYLFEILNIGDYAKSKQTEKRLKGRIIGRSGKSRGLIEELTETSISVFGKTVSIIGPTESVGNARKALEMLLKGSSHANVFKFLEKRRRESKQIVGI